MNYAEKTDVRADLGSKIWQSLILSIVSWNEEAELSDAGLQFCSGHINLAFRVEVIPLSYQALTAMDPHSRSGLSSLVNDRRNQEIKSALISRLYPLIQESQLSDAEWSRWIRPVNESSNLDFSKPDSEIICSTSSPHIDPAFIEATLRCSGLSINDAGYPSTSSST